VSASGGVTEGANQGPLALGSPENLALATPPRDSVESLGGLH